MRTPDPAQTTQMLVDGYGRHVSDIRVSLTDRCNFRCVYCARTRSDLVGVRARDASADAPLRSDPDKDSIDLAHARTNSFCAGA